MRMRLGRTASAHATIKKSAPHSSQIFKRPQGRGALPPRLETGLTRKSWFELLGGLARQVIYKFPMTGQPVRMLRGNNLHAWLDAFVANESLSSRNQLQDFSLSLSAERA